MRVFTSLTAVHAALLKLNGRKQQRVARTTENAMCSQLIKAGAALTLLMAGGVPVFAQTQAQDLGANTSAKTQIVTVKTTPQQVAFMQEPQSGSKMSPMPDPGNLAMLITGVCLVGVAASRRSVAA
jgi:hypothetical protein